MKPKPVKFYAYYRNDKMMTYDAYGDFYTPMTGIMRMWDFHHDKECMTPIPPGFTLKQIPSVDLSLIPKEFID